MSTEIEVRFNGPCPFCGELIEETEVDPFDNGYDAAEIVATLALSRAVFQTKNS